MSVAVSQALAEGRGCGDLRVDRQHGRLRRGLRGPRRSPARRARAGGRGRARQARARRARPGRRCSPCAAASTRRSPPRGSSARPRHPRPRQLGQPVPDRGPEDRRVRDRRGARRACRTCSRSPTAAAATPARSSRASRSWARFPRFLPCQSAERPTTLASAIRISDPAHAVEVAEAVAASDGTVLTVTDEQIVEAWLAAGARGGDLLRALLRRAGLAGLAHGRARGARDAGRLRRDRTRPQGHRGASTAHAPQPLTVDADPDAIAEAAR